LKSIHAEGTAVVDVLIKQDLLQEENLQLKAEAGQLRPGEAEQQLLQKREEELGSRCGCVLS
jgi:hypothetical protein